jgi:hypothetical protein
MYSKKNINSQLFYYTLFYPFVNINFISGKAGVSFSDAIMFVLGRAGTDGPAERMGARSCHPRQDGDPVSASLLSAVGRP